MISVDPKVRSFAVQAHLLTYWSVDRDGRSMKRQYVPDIVLDTTNGIVVIEVKACRFAESSRWREVEPLIRQAYRDDHNVDFSLMTEATLRVQPRLSNCEIMLAHSRDDDPAAELAVQQVLGCNPGGLQMQTLADSLQSSEISYQRMFGAVMRHCIEGNAFIDLSEPISRQTRVRLVA